MNDKYFYFKKKPNTASTTSSDFGYGVDVLAVPTSKLSFISTSPSKVVIFFDSVSSYEAVQLSEGEIFQKSFVEIATEYGKEPELVRSILDFIVSDNTKKKIMSFDVTGASSFRDSAISSTSDINAIVPSTPQPVLNRAAKSIPAGPTSFVIEGIDYGNLNNYPIFDFVAEESYITNGATTGTGSVEAWANASQRAGASDYTLVPGFVSSEPFFYTDGSRATGGVNGTHIKFSGSQGFKFDNNESLTVNREYTIFMCLGVSTTQEIASFQPIYGAEVLTSTNFSERTSFGPFPFDQSSNVAFRHAHRYGSVANVDTNAEDNTVPMDIPDLSDVETRQTCYVFVIRRDWLYNITVHNHNGDVIASIPQQLGAAYTDDTTNGPLFINGLVTINKDPFSTSANSISSWFKGSMKRFGLIQRDIGASEAANIATIMYDLYNPET